MRGRWELTEEQWGLVEPVLREARRADNRGRPWRDTRSVLNGVFWVLGTGAQWRELPEKYPPYQTCHRRFQQWIRSGRLEQVLKLLARLLYEQGKLNLDEAFVDATFASAKKGGFAVGPTRRGKGTKIVAIAAGNSLPLAVSVESASPAECRLVEQVLAGSFLDQLPAPAHRRQSLRLGRARRPTRRRLRHRADRTPPARTQTPHPGPEKAASLSQTMEGGTALRLDAQLPKTCHSVGIPHRQLSRLRSPRLYSHDAQTFMRPPLGEISFHSSRSASN